MSIWNPTPEARERIEDWLAGLGLALLMGGLMIMC